MFKDLGFGSIFWVNSAHAGQHNKATPPNGLANLITLSPTLSADVGFFFRVSGQLALRLAGQKSSNLTCFLFTQGVANHITLSLTLSADIAANENVTFVLPGNPLHP